LKAGVSDKINELLAPIRAMYEDDKAFQEAAANGYPVAAPKEKKVKKVKNKGTFYPGAGKTTGTEEVEQKLESAKIE